MRTVIDITDNWYPEGGRAKQRGKRQQPANTYCVFFSKHIPIILCSVSPPANYCKNQCEVVVGVCFSLLVHPCLVKTAVALILCLFITQAQGLLLSKAKSEMTWPINVTHSSLLGFGFLQFQVGPHPVKCILLLQFKQNAQDKARQDAGLHKNEKKKRGQKTPQGMESAENKTLWCTNAMITCFSVEVINNNNYYY